MIKLSDNDLIQLKGSGCGRYQTYISRAKKLHSIGDISDDFYEMFVNDMIDALSDCLGY